MCFFLHEQQQQKIYFETSIWYIKADARCSNVTSFHILHSFFCILGQLQERFMVFAFSLGWVNGFDSVDWWCVCVCVWWWRCGSFSVHRPIFLRDSGGNASVSHRYCSLSTHISNIKEPFQFSISCRAVFFVFVVLLSLVLLLLFIFNFVVSRLWTTVWAHSNIVLPVHEKQRHSQMNEWNTTQRYNMKHHNNNESNNEKS